jgi:membrane protein YdbS with pleckstrin-like domain
MTSWLPKTRSEDAPGTQKLSPIPVPRSPGTRHRTKPCPFCAETIRYEAVKCRFCNEFLTGDRKQVREKICPDAPGEEPEEETEASEETDVESDILWSGRPSLLALAGTAVRTTCFAALCWLAFQYPVTKIVSYIPKANVPAAQLLQIEAWIDLAALGLAMVALLVLAWKTASLKSIHYEVSPDRIEWSRGIFDRHVDNLDMFRVVDLKLRRSLLECFLGIGTVVLITKDESDPEFEFVKVRRSRSLYDILKDAGLKADKKRGVIHLE